MSLCRSLLFLMQIVPKFLSLLTTNNTKALMTSNLGYVKISHTNTKKFYESETFEHLINLFYKLNCKIQRYF